MARLLRSALLLAALAAAGVAAAPTEEEKLQKALTGLVPGKPVDCISQSPTMNSSTYDGAMLYQQGGTRYLNRFGGSCRIRANFDILIVRTYGAQLCRGDIATIIEQGSSVPRGTCIFDNFTPYAKPK